MPYLLGRPPQRRLAVRRTLLCATLQIDCKAAFQNCSRKNFVRQTKTRCPGAYRWTKICYARRSRRYIRGEDGVLHTFTETSGTSQGDPFGPADHNLAVVELMRDLAQSFNCAQLWYLDDGNLVGPVEVLAAFMNSITDCGATGEQYGWVAAAHTGATK